MSGWIKLHRKLLEWEWYYKPVVKSVFIHSLLRANHKDGNWQGKEIKRGSYISSVDKLIKELGHSRQEIRTALKHLKSTSELTITSGSQHTVFTVINYENYQESTNELTNEQPTANQPSTTNKNDKNEDNEKNTLFDCFWDLYGKKKSRAKCEPKFNKLTQADKDKIFEVLPDYIASTPDIKYRKDPQTWLNGKCWNDEIQKPLDLASGCVIDFDAIAVNFNKSMAIWEHVPEVVKVTEKQKKLISILVSDHEMTNERFKNYFEYCATSGKHDYMLNNENIPAQGLTYFLSEDTIQK